MVFFEIIPDTIYPSSCFFVTLFLVEAGYRTRLAKSGFPAEPSVCTFRFPTVPTLLVLSLDLNDDLFALAVVFLVVITFAAV